MPETRTPGLGRISKFERRLPKLPIGGDGASRQAAELAARMGELAKVVGDLGPLLDELAPGVIGTETVVLDGNGQATKQYRIPFRALSVDYFGATTLTVTAAPLASSAPGPGPGVAKVGPGGFAVVNFRAYAASFYGNPGDVLTVTAFAKPQPPNGVVNGTAGVLTSSSSSYPLGAIPVAVSSGNVANAVANALLPGAAGKTTWLSGFEVTAAGATAAAVVVVTVTGVASTLSYVFVAPAGATVAAAPLLVELPAPIPASAPNTGINVQLPALGAGNTNAAVTAHGYQL